MRAQQIREESCEVSYLALYTCPILAHPYDHPVNRDFQELAIKIMNTVPSAPGYVRFVDFPEKMPWPKYVDSQHDYPALTLSIWSDIDALITYSYHEELHNSALKQRRNWFARTDHPIYVLWFVENPDSVTYEEAAARMDFLCDHGPGPYAFDFQHLHEELGNEIGHFHSVASAKKEVETASIKLSTNTDNII